MTNQKSSAGWSNTQVYTAIIVVLLIGGVGGYLLHSSGKSADSTTSSASAPVQMPPSIASAPAQNFAAQVKPLEARLAANPRDVATLIELGNLSFDAGQWPSAVGYYTRALNETPHNPDVRTDLGISYFYSGDADRALAEFDTALKDDPRHAQTLYNIGVVKMGGKNDPKGAIAAWESLLKIAPNYQDRVKVEQMIAEARAKVK
jgi:cytochrome c-type biogenesis protein CcmH/NrfG